MNIPNSIKEKIREYEKLYGKKPKGWNYREQNLNDYEKDLEMLIKEKRASTNE